MKRPTLPKEEKLKLTPIRLEILSILKESTAPICAKAIKDKFILSADLSNVYRNLNTLELDRIICSISFKGIKYYYESESKSGHFILCKGCGEIQSFHNCHEHTLQKELENQFGYKITNHNLYFEGYCGTCNKAPKDTI